MSEATNGIDALTNAFKQITSATSEFANATLIAARSIRQLHRNMVLYIRAHYVEAGKPYGNGYAPMMKWWRQQYAG